MGARCNNKEPFPIPLNAVWEIFESELFALNLLYGTEIQAFVLMPNHFHLIVTVPNEDLGKMMNLLMANVTRRVNLKSGRSGHLFGGPHFRSIIKSTRYYGHVLKYVYRNPVRAGLCRNTEDYAYSTAHRLFGFQPLHIPLSFTRIGMETNLPDPLNLGHWVSWLNRPFPREAEALVRKAIYRKEITTLLDRVSRKPTAILDQLL